MEKWEYLVESVPSYHEGREDLRMWLNEYGRDGWELVQLIGLIAYFKRRVQ